MQNEYGFLKLHGVDSTVRSAHIIFDHFQDASATESIHHLCRTMSITMLCEVQSVAKELPNVARKSHQVFFAASNPDKRFFLKHEYKFPFISVEITRIGPLS